MRIFRHSYHSVVYSSFQYHFLHCTLQGQTSVGPQIAG